MKKVTVILLLLVFVLLIFNAFNIYNQYEIKQFYFDAIYGHFRGLEVVINDAKMNTEDILTNSTYSRLYEQTHLSKLSLDFGKTYIDDKLARSYELREIQTTIERMKDKELTKADYLFLDYYYDTVLNLLNEMTEGGEYSIILKDDIQNTRKESLWRSEFNYIIENFNNRMGDYFSSIRLQSND